MSRGNGFRDWFQRTNRASRADNPEERSRVYGRIAPLILAFKAEVGDAEFHAEDLRRYVLLRAPEMAPASPDRILRELRQDGLLDYDVTNRRKSLYQFIEGDAQ